MDEKIFLKNSLLIEEIYKSKLTYCCYEKGKGYENYDQFFESYDLIVPAPITDFFKSNPDKKHIIIKIDTNEHMLSGYKNERSISACMQSFKHFLLTKEDFETINRETNVDVDRIESYENEIYDYICEKMNLEKRKKELSAIKVRDNDKKEFESLKKDIDSIKTSIDELKNKISIETSAFSKSIRPYMKEVLRSHYKGTTIDNCVYDLNGGRLTNKLCKMFTMLVDKYIKSGNWSGYTYTEDMVSAAILKLVEKALSFDESKSTNAFGLMTQIAKNEFRIILNKEKEQRDIKSEKMQENGYDAPFSEQYREQDVKKFGENY